MEMGKGLRASLAVCALLSGTIAGSGAADAQSVEQFYKGKQIKFMLGSAGGGG